ncbi:VWA domain-containing protein [Streptomyces fradiae]|uniref:VWA domain-containing protein n=1 Tax=Streptomyces fradiae TaxID=1906 RepID=UPI0039877D1A
MGIRSLLRKVFGRDRDDERDAGTSTALPSVPPQAERTVPRDEPSTSATVPSQQDRQDTDPTPEEVAAELVAASFDDPKPTIPPARTDSAADPEAETAPKPEADTTAPASGSGVDPAREADAAAPASGTVTPAPEADAAPAGPEAEAAPEPAAEATAAPAEAAAAPQPATEREPEAARSDASEEKTDPAAAASAVPEAEARAAEPGDAPSDGRPATEASTRPEAGPDADAPTSADRAPTAGNDAAPAPAPAPAPAAGTAETRTPDTGADADATAGTEATGAGPQEARDGATAEEESGPAADPEPETTAADERPATAGDPTAAADRLDPAPAQDEPEPATTDQPEPSATDAPEPTGTTATEPATAEAVPATEPATAEAVPATEPATAEATTTEAALAPAPAAQPEPGTSAVALRQVKRVAPEGVAEAYKAAGAALRGRGLLGARATVYLVLDRSGSMRPYYKDGSAQRLGEQSLALAAHLDEKATVPVVFFSTEIDGTGELTLDNAEDRVTALHDGLGRMGRTHYERAVREVLAQHEQAGADRPALVIFQTDGAPESRTAATQALKEAAATGRPVFWQFVAFGEEDAKAFDYLRRLDVENTAFVHAGPTPKDVPHARFFRELLAAWSV